MDTENPSGSLMDGTQEQPSASLDSERMALEDQIATETLNEVLQMLDTCMKIELHKFRSTKIRADRRAFLARATVLQDFGKVLEAVRDGEQE